MARETDIERLVLVLGRLWRSRRGYPRRKVWPAGPQGDETIDDGNDAEVDVEVERWRGLEAIQAQGGMEDMMG